jgi:hypothetical protein
MTEMPNSGDHDERKVVVSSRHELCFSHDADGFIGIQVNKSDVTPENIHPGLLALVKDRMRAWSKKIYKLHFKEGSVPGTEAEFEKELKRVMKEFKNIARAKAEMAVLAKFKTWLETLDEEEDSEEDSEANSEEESEDEEA